MEELRSTEILDREIQEDARKKAAKIIADKSRIITWEEVRDSMECPKLLQDFYADVLKENDR